MKNHTIQTHDDSFYLSSEDDRKPIEVMEYEAMKYICNVNAKNGKLMVLFSGGKDSCVLYDLVKRVLPKEEYQAYYNATFIDPPELMQFIKKEYPEVIWLKPDITFWQGLSKKGPPTTQRRWCCDKLKHGTKESKSIPLKHRLAGVRAEESPKRAERGMETYYKQLKQTLYHPIFWWSSAEVWEYIKRHNIKYCSLYDQGHTRLGCVICPFISKNEIELYKKTWPKYYKTLEKYLTEFYLNSGRSHDTFTLEQYLKWPCWDKRDYRANMEFPFDTDED